MSSASFRDVRAEVWSELLKQSSSQYNYDKFLAIAEPEAENTVWKRIQAGFPAGHFIERDTPLNLIYIRDGRSEYIYRFKVPSLQQRRSFWLTVRTALLQGRYMLLFMEA